MILTLNPGASRQNPDVCPQNSSTEDNTSTYTFPVLDELTLYRGSIQYNVRLHLKCIGLICRAYNVLAYISSLRDRESDWELGRNVYENKLQFLQITLCTLYN